MIIKPMVMKTYVHQQKESVQRSPQAGKRSTTRIADNRPSSIMQKKLANAIQQKTDEEELMQGKFAMQRAIEDEELQGKFIQRAENKTGMPDNLKSGVEQLSGLDMSDVRVHFNSAKPASVQAHAYTQGTNIHVAPGQERHLAHEAWHVAQQKQGRVQPTTEVAGMPVNDNVALETEADVMGAKASSL